MTATGSDVFLMQPDRSGLVQLTTDPKLDSAPVLSPDGARVAFERTDPDDWQCRYLDRQRGRHERDPHHADRPVRGLAQLVAGRDPAVVHAHFPARHRRNQRDRDPDRRTRCSASAAGVGHGRVPTGESPGRRDGTCADVVAGWIVDRVHLGQGRREAAIHDPCRRLQPEEADHGRRDEPARLVPGLVDDRATRRTGSTVASGSSTPRATTLGRSRAITARTARWPGRPTGRWSPGREAARNGSDLGGQRGRNELPPADRPTTGTAISAGARWPPLNRRVVMQPPNGPGRADRVRSTQSGNASGPRSASSATWAWWSSEGSHEYG